MRLVVRLRGRLVKGEGNINYKWFHILVIICMRAGIFLGFKKCPPKSLAIWESKLGVKTQYPLMGRFSHLTSPNCK